MLPMRLYTAGIADFESIREKGRIYVDKTDLIYKLTQESKFVFLSRPRRFGSSSAVREGSASRCFAVH